jgi:putative transposase
MIIGLQQGLKDDGIVVSLVKLCRWFDVPRRTVYYWPTKTAPKPRPGLLNRSRP